MSRRILIVTLAMLMAQLPAGQGLAGDAEVTRTLLGQGWTYM